MNASTFITLLLIGALFKFQQGIILGRAQAAVYKIYFFIKWRTFMFE